MGSCISKCRPKTVSEEECENVQDKLVISLAPTSPISVLDIKPPSPSPSHLPLPFLPFPALLATLLAPARPQAHLQSELQGQGMLANAPQESVCKRSTSPKGNAVNSSLSSVRKGSVNLRPPSPNNNSSRHPPCLRNREMGSQPNVGSKIGEIAVGEVLSNLGIDSLPTEDIDNPLISLDCFIFL
ncbi:hypothetical protein CK203_005522 [Vitis vinifera]|uniref:Uncharacterized protein n=1 Tax=Vitis vinifera TaxID=29760 RepID=A0A438K3F7_VITVI|nr:hypothetical protein CK203_005522 [Vitis vinifera]